MAKSDFNFRTPIRVRWMECDAQGIVFNGAYMGYLEVAQSEYFRNLGFGIYRIAQIGYFDFAVVKTTLEYKSPARIDEMIEVYVRVSNFGNTSMTLNMEIYHPDSGRLLTKMEAVYVGYDAPTETTCRVPDDIRQLANHFEETGEVLPINNFPELAKARA
jgi:acyl-CoA thioester hydrolase